MRSADGTGGAAETERGKNPRRLGPILIAWMVLYGASLASYNAIPGLREEMIHCLQVVPASWLLTATLPGVMIQAGTTSIHAPGLEVKIMDGCDGVEAWLLLAAAMFVFPMSWRRRWQGAALGTLILYVLNLVRIVTLFHLAWGKPAWMEVAHLVMWQCIIVLAAGGFVLVWLAPRQRRPTDAGARP